MELQFLGASGTVTGSRYLATAGNFRMLVDCGLFQGYKQLRLRNWAPLPFAPAELTAVVLTHAHLDHSGYLPLLVRNGFRGPIYCTPATRDLCGILLPDSGRLLEEEAEHANRHGWSRHKPALPLYTEKDAMVALERFRPVAFERLIELAPGIAARFLPAGHILGAAMIRLRAEGRDILFSGDLGRPNDLLMAPPSQPGRCDYLVIESTYGDRRHSTTDPVAELGAILTRTIARGGVVVIPAFAVGRTQALLKCLHLLKRSGAVPADLPVYLNSPLAADATAIYKRHHREHRLGRDSCEAVCRVPQYVNTVEESKRLDTLDGPMVIIAGSGMATGGRVVHHLKRLLPDARNTVLFAGFQASGTRGAALLNGAERIKIHGQYVPVRAEIAMLESLSSHADYAEILDWLKRFRTPPRQTFITHGEPAAADALRMRIEEELGWSCCVPEHLATHTLENAAAAAA